MRIIAYKNKSRKGSFSVTFSFELTRSPHYPGLVVHQQELRGDVISNQDIRQTGSEHRSNRWNVGGTSSCYQNHFGVALLDFVL